MQRIYILILATLFGCTVAKSQQIEGVKPEVLRIADSLTGISMHNTDLECCEVSVFPLITEPQIKMEN